MNGLVCKVASLVLSDYITDQQTTDLADVFYEVSDKVT